MGFVPFVLTVVVPSALTVTGALVYMTPSRSCDGVGVAGKVIGTVTDVLSKVPEMVQLMVAVTGHGAV
jgi:hypothetical protein